MTDSPRTPADRLLDRLHAGDEAAGRELFTLLYDELKTIARRQIERLDGGSTMQPTALVHEAWIKLCSGDAVQMYSSRFHFYCIAAKGMRSVLVDQARERRAEKRGSGKKILSLDQSGNVASVDQPAAGSVDLLPLHEALARLELVDEELSEIVLLRFFAGLGNDEIATLRGISRATVERRFAVARGWLHRAMTDADQIDASKDAGAQPES
jgi:RNA polymerase sigma-70 factor, ECF subfamily